MLEAIKNFFWPASSIFAGILLILLQVIFEVGESSCSINDIMGCIGWIDSFLGYLFIFAAFLWVISQIPNIKTKQDLINTKKALNEREYELSQYEEYIENAYTLAQELLNYVVKDIFRALRLNHEYRISLYIEVDEYFQLVSRYSRDPELTKPGRAFYPKNQGFINVAWREQEFFIDDLPDPDEDWDGYKEAIPKKASVPEATLAQIRMKSQTYFACAVADAKEERHKGVLIIEANCPRALTRQAICECLHRNEYKRHLQNVLEQAWDWLPNVAQAEREGL